MILSTGIVKAQKSYYALKKEFVTGEEDASFDAAEAYFAAQNYWAALPYYEVLHKRFPKNNYLLFQLGICYLSKTDELEKSISLLEETKQKEPELDALNFYLGRAYMLNYKFDEAIKQFNDYLLKANNIERIKTCKLYIKNCENAKNISADTLRFNIRNLGDPINTNNSEYVPVISADESVMIYTYRGERSTGGKQDAFLKKSPYGEYYEDVFISYKVGDNWMDPESIGENINTNSHDAAIALSADGQKLFVYNSTSKNGGDIYMSKLNGDVWSKPESIGPEINTKYWEGSMSLSADENMLIFASERTGGLGGRDLYKSMKQKDGKWGKPINLGPKINTELDEDAPFIHPDGKSFFFSSQGHTSMGGYDIYYCSLEGEKISDPKNLGYPLNTMSDDKYFVMNASGERAYYSSASKGGLGQQDIYSFEPKVLGILPVLVLIKGSITDNNTPLSAVINVYDATTNEKVATFNSNAATGKYLLALLPGKNYRVAFEVQGYEEFSQMINLTSLDRFVEVVQDFNMAMYRLNQAKDSTQTTSMINTRIGEEISKIKLKEAIAQADNIEYVQILKTKGFEEKENQEYFVEVDNTEVNKNIVMSGKAVPVEEVKSTNSADASPKLKAGPFKTLIEADEYKRVVSAKNPNKPKPEIMVKSGDVVAPAKQFFAPKDSSQQSTTTLAKNKSAGSGETGKVNEARYNEILQEFYKTEIAGVNYKLEIGAFENPDDFKMDYLKEFGEIEAKKFGDGKTRYSFGPFKTLVEAEVFKQKVLAKYPEAEKFFVTVFSMGERKLLEEQFKSPCASLPFYDFANYFKGKDLNDPTVYRTLLEKGKLYCAEGLIFTVQIGAYRKPQNFTAKAESLKKYGELTVKNFEDGITRFTMNTFTTLQEADDFRLKLISNGAPKDAVVTAIYKGKRMLLKDLLNQNFYLPPVK
ncbi:MAG: hypothetical protein V4667_02965 [Bacteroidota bacterium]